MAGSDDEAESALRAIRALLQTGRLPEEWADRETSAPESADIIRNLEQTQAFVLALANGNLDIELQAKGRMAGALKSLQANLRHLTWQTQQIASGDLSQQVRFMGEFAIAFNTMVERLKESRQALEDRAAELAEQRQAAHDLMLEAQAARRSVEQINARLQAQYDEIAALQAQLREEAIRDPLTSCFNRRYLDEMLLRELSRARREGSPLSVAIADIDHFKSVNDDYGHQAGDAVLRRLGEMLRGCIRAEDLVCRWGGEEFLIMLQGASAADALRRAEQWRSDFASGDTRYGGRQIRATMSIGVAEFPSNGETREEVIRAADEALYRAKRLGRNRVVAAGSGGGPSADGGPMP